MRFCFYSGYKDLKGGYTTLLITLIRELVNRKQEVVLINFTEGLIAEELSKESIEVLIIDMDSKKWKDISAMILPTDIFIIAKFEEIYRHLFHVNPRTVYFDINDFICHISDYKFGIRLPSLGKKLVKELLTKKSLFFMDDTGIFNLKQNFGISVKDPAYLPIPVTVPCENAYLKHHISTRDTLKFTYIGRSVNWKMMPLRKILEDCAKFSLGHKILFSIVVDSREDFAEFINLEEYAYAANLSINVEENMPPSSINEFLLKNTDLHFAMGTAALDAAKLGIPTILVDYGTAPFPQNYQYKWLFHTSNYSLGRNLDKMPFEHSNGISMANLIDLFSGNGESLNYYSEFSYKYVCENHAVENGVNRLIAACNLASFRMANAKKYVPFYFNAHLVIKKIAGTFKK